MDTRELRIGDFVYYKDEKCKILVIAIDQVAIRIGRRHKYNPTDISDIQPIPITDELLEEIGFKNEFLGVKMFGYRLLLDKSYTSIWYRKDFKKYLIRILDNDGNIILGEKHISYLHELQHELYDAGDIKIELE